jgi:predicted metal-dependent hydrolase
MSLLARLRGAAPAPSTPAEIAGVPVRVSARARRMALRQETRTGRVVLTLPQRKTWTARAESAARLFIEQNRDWIARHERPARASPPPAPGQSLAVLGRDYLLRHQPGRGLDRIGDGEIVVTGDIAHFSRRLKDVLKRHAGEVLTARTHEKSAQLGLPPRDVRLRDPASRWGSCGPDGRIMYSWRLVLTPEWVMDYVVAHEVAHRVHMDHSRAFWRLCLGLTARGGEARRWLARHGAEVMRV